MTKREKLKQILSRAKRSNPFHKNTDFVTTTPIREKTKSKPKPRTTVAKSISAPAVGIPWGIIGTILFYLFWIAVIFGIVCLLVLVVAQVIPFFLYFFSGLALTFRFIFTNPLALIVFVVGIIVCIKVQLGI